MFDLKQTSKIYGVIKIREDATLDLSKCDVDHARGSINFDGRG